MAWQPKPEIIHSLGSLLSQYHNPLADHGTIYAQMETFKQLPDFECYLVYMLSQWTAFNPVVCQSAGLLLKTRVKSTQFQFDAQVQGLIKQTLLNCLGSSLRVIRNTVSTVISSIVGFTGFAPWPELLERVNMYLESPDQQNLLEESLEVLFKIFEEHAGPLHEEILQICSRFNLIEKLINRMGHDKVSVRLQAITCLFEITPVIFADGESKKGDHMAVVDAYLQRLFKLAYDEDRDVQIRVCMAFVQLLQLLPEKLSPHLSGLINYSLTLTRDAEKDLALEACEFWNAYLESELPQEHLHPILKDLIIVLTERMKYEDDDEDVLDAQAQEHGQALPRGTDVKSFRFRASNKHMGVEEEFDEEEDVVVAWNLRKSSAQALDSISIVFGDEILPILLPIVQERLNMGDWKSRESAILVLGAVSQGCGGLDAHLSEIAKIVMPQMSHPHALVRSISCWTLSRFITPYPPPTEKLGMFSAIYVSLIDKLGERHPKVQEAACSAVTTFIEDGPVQIVVQNVEKAVDAIVSCVQFYHGRNLHLLYDMLTSFAQKLSTPDACGILQDIRYESKLLSPMMKKLISTQSLDMDFLALAQSTGTMVLAFDKMVEPYIESTLQFAIAVLNAQIQLKEGGGHQAGQFEPKCVAVVLDLISGLAEAVGSSMDRYLGQHDISMHLCKFCKYESAEISQSVFYVFGTLLQSCPTGLQNLLHGGTLQELVSSGIDSMDMERVSSASDDSVANNACWAIGQLALHFPSSLDRSCVLILSRCLPFLERTAGYPRPLVENASILVGRMGMHHSKALAPYMEHYMWNWLVAIATLCDSIEKEHAFMGLYHMLINNVDIGFKYYGTICNAVASWYKIHNESLKQMISQLLHEYKNQFISRSEWSNVQGSLTPVIYSKLQREYNL